VIYNGKIKNDLSGFGEYGGQRKAFQGPEDLEDKERPSRVNRTWKGLYKYSIIKEEIRDF